MHRWKKCLTATLLLFGLGAFAIALADGKSASGEGRKPAATSKHHEVEVVRDLAYVPGPDADPVKNKLDVYFPKEHKDFPVVLFVHGGGWRHGDKNYWFDLYGRLGRALARQGVGAVVINYRLAPAVGYAEQMHDLARAVAWTRNHVSTYGGRADQLFLCGHSAGGHLIALCATDPQYLKSEGLSVRDLKGVIPISGVFDVRPDIALFRSLFGDQADARAAASPVCRVGKAPLPPFLILYADGDFPGADRMAEDFCKALTAERVESKMCKINQRDHLSIIAHCVEEEDPAFRALVEFITRHTTTPAGANAVPAKP